MTSSTRGRGGVQEVGDAVPTGGDGGLKPSATSSTKRAVSGRGYRIFRKDKGAGRAIKIDE